MFQFQIGAIRSVSLKARRRNAAPIRFNSKLVRLEEFRFPTASRTFFKFQFQIGAIRSLRGVDVSSSGLFQFQIGAIRSK